MWKIKRIVLVSLTGVSGLLLTFAGLSLIEISQDLILYTGLTLLILSLLQYIFSRGSQTKKAGKEQT